MDGLPFQPSESQIADVSPLTDRLTTALAGRYRIDRELGAGGMATVYLADDLGARRTALSIGARAWWSGAQAAVRG
jgi:hypothetical protein